MVINKHLLFLYIKIKNIMNYFDDFVKEKEMLIEKFRLLAKARIKKERLEKLKKIDAVRKHI